MGNTKFSNKRKRLIAEKTNGHCWYCGKPPELFQTYIDHQHPVCRNGGNELSNLVIACIDCNSSKGSKTVEEYRLYLMLRDFDAGNLNDYYRSLKLALKLSPSLSHQKHLARLIQSVERYATSQPVVFWAERGECDRPSPVNGDCPFTGDGTAEVGT